MNIKKIKKLPNIVSASIAKKIDVAVKIVMFIVSVLTMAAIVVDYGFELPEREMVLIHKVYNTSWWFFFSVFMFQLIFQWRSITRKTATMTSAIGILLLVSALPKFFVLSESMQWLSIIWTVGTNKFYLIALLGVFSILNISQGIVGFINKKTNPALLMSVCFAIFILFGALLLLLPRSTHEGITLPLVDALFISTSAVCVTGLTPVDIAQTFSVEGQMVIALLIQIGGLGVMTITSFFAMFFMGRSGLYSQFALSDMIGSNTFSSLLSTLFYILGFTFVIEVIGAVCIWLSVHGSLDMTLGGEIFFALFHSISAFCNAGFSTMEGNLSNPLLISGHNGFYLIISLLVILGGIGFPILMNFKSVIGYHLREFFATIVAKKRGRIRYNHLVNINTKIALVVTALLLIAGTVVIAMLEWHYAFADMSVPTKIVHAFFNATVPRTAGFVGVDITQFSFLTILTVIILMWIGGASQSTAGGIKVNTFAVAIANFISIIRGKSSVTLFNREISENSVRRASATIFGSTILIVVAFIILLVIEPFLPPLSLLFETVSAFSTVGSSLNLTPLLGADSKIVLTLLMFAGRVGLITVLMSVVPQSKPPKYKLPKDNVIIN